MNRVFKFAFSHLNGIKVFALVGRSGTGKSHHSKLLAQKYHIDLIIDDDLIQCQNALKLNLKAILFNKDSHFNGPQATTWQEVYEIINH